MDTWSIQAEKPFSAGHSLPLEIKATMVHLLFLLSAQLVPSSLLPSLWPTCPELSVERGTQAELSGQLRALFLMEFSL